MKALTLHRPWDWAIVHGHKTVENRTWSAPQSVIGHHIAIHAGQTWSEEGRKAIIELTGRVVTPREYEWPAGEIVGVARVVSCVMLHNVPRRTGSGNPNPWASGPWCWMLDRMHPCHPVGDELKVKGRQGLWNLTPEMEAAVRASVPVKIIS